VSPTGSVTALELLAAAAGTGSIPADSVNVPPSSWNTSEGRVSLPGVKAEDVPEAVPEEPCLASPTGAIGHEPQAYGPLHRLTPTPRSSNTSSRPLIVGRSGARNPLSDLSVGQLRQIRETQFVTSISAAIRY